MNDKETMAVIAGTVGIILWAMDEFDDRDIVDELKKVCPPLTSEPSEDIYGGVLDALENIKKIVNGKKGKDGNR